MKYVSRPKFQQQVNNWEIRNSTVVQKIKTWKALYWKTVEQKPITQRGKGEKKRMTRVNGLKLWKCRVYNLISSASQVVTHRWWMSNKCGHGAGKNPCWAQIYCPEEPCWGSDGSGGVGAGPGGRICALQPFLREETLEDKAESHRAPPKEGWGHSSSIKGRQTEQHWHCRRLECTWRSARVALTDNKTD